MNARWRPAGYNSDGEEEVTLAYPNPNQNQNPKPNPDSNPNLSPDLDPNPKTNPNPNPNQGGAHTKGVDGAALKAGLPFAPSAHFAGARPGYLFTTRESGVGYYRDPRQPIQGEGAGEVLQQMLVCCPPPPRAALPHLAAASPHLCVATTGPPDRLTA